MRRLWLVLWLVLPPLLTWGDQLQYNPVTMRVTGYSTAPIGPVPNHEVVEVSSGFLAAIPQPAGCNFRGEQVQYLYRVTSLDPFTVEIDDVPCLEGKPMFTRQEVDDHLQRRLDTLPKRPLSFCPDNNMSPACQRLRERNQLTPEEIEALDTLYQQADSVKGRLP